MFFMAFYNNFYDLLYNIVVKQIALDALCHEILLLCEIFFQNTIKLYN